MQHYLPMGINSRSNIDYMYFCGFSKSKFTNEIYHTSRDDVYDNKLFMTLQFTLLYNDFSEFSHSEELIISFVEL